MGPSLYFSCFASCLPTCRKSWVRFITYHKRMESEIISIRKESRNLVSSNLVFYSLVDFQARPSILWVYVVVHKPFHLFLYFLLLLSDCYKHDWVDRQLLSLYHSNRDFQLSCLLPLVPKSFYLFNRLFYSLLIK